MCDYLISNSDTLPILPPMSLSTQVDNYGDKWIIPSLSCPKTPGRAYFSAPSLSRIPLWRKERCRYRRCGSRARPYCLCICTLVPFLFSRSSITDQGSRVYPFATSSARESSEYPVALSDYLSYGAFPPLIRIYHAPRTVARPSRGGAGTSPPHQSAAPLLPRRILRNRFAQD